MSKSNNKKVSVIGLIGIIIMIFTGCTHPGPIAEKQSPEHIAIVVSNTKNEGAVDTNNLSEDISKISLISNSTATVISADGKPEIVDTYSIPTYKSGISENKKQQLSENYAAQIISVMSSLTPNDEELDLFGAIDIAARQLKDYSEGDKTLYIVSSGLSTKGLVNFTDLYLEDDHSEKLCEMLAKNLPDLTGVRILWFGLGEVEKNSTQTPLYESNRDILMNTWKSVLMAGGVSEGDIAFSSAVSVNTNKDKSNLPYVSEIPIVQPSSVMVDVDFELPKDNNSKTRKNQVLDLQESVPFEPDSTELKNENESVKSLRKIIQYLKENPNSQILLVGTTSSAGEEKSLKKFSYKRAESIKKIFLSSGVKDNQIICVGAGYGSNLTIKDRDAENKLIERKAQRNRTVWLFTDATSNSAKKLIEAYK